MKIIVSRADRDEGILKYTIRSILQNASFIGTIYIFKDSPNNYFSWLDKSMVYPKIQMIDRCKYFTPFLIYNADLVTKKIRKCLKYYLQVKTTDEPHFASSKEKSGFEVRCDIFIILQNFMNIFNLKSN